MVKLFIKIFFIIFFIILIGFLLYSFLLSDKIHPQNTIGYFKERFPYDLLRPGEKIVLPLELREISGISYLKDNLLVGIEDNHGIIYSIDYQSGKIINRFQFAKDRDYEDVTVADNTAYILSSNGRIYPINNILNQDESIEKDKRLKFKSKSTLNMVKDAEGLCYYEKNNTLLIAYKKYSGNKLKNLNSETANQSDKKPIFAYDLTQEKLKPEPDIILDFAEYRKISGLKINNSSFKPSGIAVHPITGNIYLISSVSKQLLTISPSGELIFLVELDRNIFRQPEGICFLPNGNLLISSEGVYSSGYILLFPYNG